MMGEVYQKAKAMRVWVGPFGEKGELGMDLLAEAEDFMRTHGDGEYVVDAQMRRPLQHWVHKGSMFQSSPSIGNHFF
jgi:hypothetical protein